MRETRGGVGRDIAVVARVQAGCRTICREAEADDAAYPERDTWQSTRIDRTIAEQPKIGREQIAMELQRLRKVR
ncbi:MAG: hypothetical protein IPG56_01730 [Caulobacteraceae bacterium]|nr:hypothetical protein [Caulobacteraceae bacterium]